MHTEMHQNVFKVVYLDHLRVYEPGHIVYVTLGRSGEVQGQFYSFRLWSDFEFFQKSFKTHPLTVLAIIKDIFGNTG